MISFASFADELQKIAEAQSDYKRVRVGDRTVLLRKGVPVVGRLPKDPEKATNKIQQLIRSERAKHSVLGYRNVAIRENAMDPEAMGFKQTRMATPLPGEGLFSKTWRRGVIHAHKQGPLYLVHEDVDAPHHPEHGYWHRKAIRHAVKEGLPTMAKRFWKSQRPLVKEEAR